MGERDEAALQRNYCASTDYHRQKQQRAVDSIVYFDSDTSI
jgi:hypothetical protein